MKVSAVAFVIYAATNVSPAWGQSLVDIARQNGGSAGSVTDVCGPVQSLLDVLSQSELVVHGRIVDVKTRLSSDETQVITEYTIAPIQAFKDTRPASVSTPGAVSRIVVQRTGGTLLTTDGLRLWTSINSFPASECFALGEEVVAFLAYNNDTRAYYFASGAFGAYRIRDGMVTPMTREVVSRRGDRPIETAVFFKELLRLRSVVDTRD
jgi:hypothetical protein